MQTGACNPPSLSTGMRRKNQDNKKIIKPKEVCTVIEFSNCSIKLAQSYFAKRRFISKLIAKDQIADSESEFAKELDRIIKENQIKINDLIVSLDRSLVTIRSLKLPHTSEDEIKKMAEWQASKLLPYKVEEMIVSHQTVGIDVNGFAHLILVIVPIDIIRKFINTCEILKLRPKIITLSSEGLLRWYVDVQSRHTKDTLLLVDVEKNKSEIVIINQDKFIFSRSFSWPQIQDSGQIDNKIIEEIKLSREYFNKQEDSPKIKKIVITGDKERILTLAPSFKESFGLPVETIDHLLDVDFKEGPSYLTIRKSYSFASVCGLALGKRPLQINLCPPEIKDKILFLEKKRAFFTTAVLLISAMLVFASTLAFSIYHKKNIIGILDKQINKINPAALEIQEIKDKISIINYQMDNKNSCIEILREIHRLSPPGIYLNTLKYVESEKVTIKGTSPNMSSVFSFVPILNKSPFFENVQVRYATQRKTGVGELTDFEIICRLAN